MRTEVNNDNAVITHGSGSTFEITQEFSNRKEVFRTDARVVDDTNLILLTPYRTANDFVTPVQRWANEIWQVMEALDYWVEMRRGRELVAHIEQHGADNSPFTQDERRQIAAQLQEITKQLKEQFELTTDQVEQIKGRFDEAAEASKRMGRKDWLLLFGGTILNLIVTDTLTPGVARRIFTMVIQAIAHLFTGGPPQILT